MNGFLLIDKPAGITSNQVLNILKKKVGINKMGHTGTLDPFATGLLVVGVGEAVKFIPYLHEEPKVYEADLQLGVATNTLDCDGSVTHIAPIPELDMGTIKSALKSFLGDTEQIPPMFSAKRQKGERLYNLAYRGMEVEREHVKINIADIELIKFQSPTVSFRVACSRGTYVRVLGEDIAKKFGTNGHLSKLRRLSQGCFYVSDAHRLDDEWNLKDILISIELSLNQLKLIQLDDDQAKKVIRGQPVLYQMEPIQNHYVLLKYEDQFVGVGEVVVDQIRPKRLVSTQL